MFKELEKLIRIIKKNKHKNVNISYTASLIKKGKKLCIKKFLEESKELASAANNSNNNHIIHETADLIYHLFVLLEVKKISLKSVIHELKKRQKISGIQEKKRRKLNVRQK
jgi:phosphoribosyl-ATP pyrophosphohydrolase